jgi:hypothetical protein
MKSPQEVKDVVEAARTPRDIMFAAGAALVFLQGEANERVRALLPKDEDLTKADLAALDALKSVCLEELNAVIGKPQENPNRIEFDALFLQATGMSPDAAPKNKKGEVFISREEHSRLTEAERQKMGHLTGPFSQSEGTLQVGEEILLGYWIDTSSV